MTASRCRSSSRTTGRSTTRRRGSPSTWPRASPAAGCRGCGRRCWRPVLPARSSGISGIRPARATPARWPLTVLPALASRLAVTARIGLGASLGALAMLHAQWRNPARFAGLFLQSGSYFQPALGWPGAGVPLVRRIVRFVARHRRRPRARRADRDRPAGRRGSKLHNNRLMAACLRAQGYPGDLRGARPARLLRRRDAFDPYLTSLLQQVLREPDDPDPAPDRAAARHRGRLAEGV